MKHPFSIVGIFFALAGIAVAVFQQDIRLSGLYAKPVIEEKKTLKARIVEKGKKLVELVKGKKKEQPDYFKRDAVTLTYMLLGFLGLVLGVIGFVKKESHRVVATAVGLGMVAIAWYYVLYAFAVAVFIIILGSLG